jgi:hypothetical protein
MRRGLEPSRVRASYVDGECHYFALALQRATGCPLLEVGNADRSGHFVGGHFVVELPDGDVADASGRQEREALLAEWGANELRPLDAAVLLKDLAGDEDDTPTDAPVPGHVLERLDAAERALLSDRGFLDALGVPWSPLDPMQSAPPGGRSP